MCLVACSGHQKDPRARRRLPYHITAGRFVDVGVSVWLRFAQPAGLLKLCLVEGSCYKKEELEPGYSFGYSCFLSSSGSSCCTRAILIWETGTGWDGAWGGARGRGVGLWVSAGVQLQVRGGPCHALCGYLVDAGWVRRPRQGLRIQPGWASLAVESDCRTVDVA